MTVGYRWEDSILSLAVLAAIAGATFAGLNSKPRKPLRRHRKLGIRKPAPSLLKQADGRVQRFFASHVDPLFNASERNQHLAEFAPGIDEEERGINRRLVTSIGMVGVAGVAAFGAPILAVVSMFGPIAVLGPIIVKYSVVGWRERKLKYRGLAALGCVLSAFAGFYLAASVVAMSYVVFLKLAARTKASTYETICSTYGLQPPEKVWVKVDGAEIQKPFSELKIGDLVVVNAGQTIPVDGVVKMGDGAVDQHALTGEAQPFEKAQGDRVLANTLLLSGRLDIEVERAGTDTSAAQIANILVTASRAKMDVADRNEQFADTITPPLLAASAVAMATVGPSGAFAIMHGGFGSVAVVAGPLCMLNFLNRASRQGVLIKDGRALEKLHEVNAFVFDKTGTLTVEQPAVAEIHATGDVLPAAVLQLASLAEFRQQHPIARAILAEAETRGLDVSPPENAEYRVGMGIIAQTDGQLVQVGSARFMQACDVSLPLEADAWHSACQHVGGSLVFVSVDGHCVGAIRLEPQLRNETQELINRLMRRGHEIYILSGDAKEPTEYLAGKLGVTGFFAEVLPQDKARIVNRLQEKGRSVCFIGDGVNDALALQQADVSISMRGATTIANDCAQIIVLGHSLMPIEQLIDLGAQYRRNLQRTLAIGNSAGFVLIGGVFALGFGMSAAMILAPLGLGGAVASALLSPDARKQYEAGATDGRARLTGRKKNGASRFARTTDAARTGVSQAHFR